MAAERPGNTGAVCQVLPTTDMHACMLTSRLLSPDTTQRGGQCYGIDQLLWLQLCI